MHKPPRSGQCPKGGRAPCFGVASPPILCKSAANHPMLANAAREAWRLAWAFPVHPYFASQSWSRPQGYPSPPRWPKPGAVLVRCQSTYLLQVGRGRKGSFPQRWPASQGRPGAVLQPCQSTHPLQLGRGRNLKGNPPCWPMRHKTSRAPCFGFASPRIVCKSAVVLRDRKGSTPNAGQYPKGARALCFELADPPIFCKSAAIPRDREGNPPTPAGAAGEAGRRASSLKIRRSSASQPLSRPQG